METENNKNELLLSISIKCSGDFDDMLGIIQKREKIEKIEKDKIETNFNGYTTLLDKNYPKHFKHSFKPPIVFFYKGNEELLQNHCKTLIFLNGRQSSKYATDSSLSIISSLKGYDVLALTITTPMIHATFDVLEIQGIKPLLVLEKSFKATESNKTYKEIINRVLSLGGLVITEIPDTANDKVVSKYYPRLLAATGNCVLVGGISKTDKMTQTIGYALNNGADICCVPFEVGSNYINNKLIKDGANLVETADDLPSKKDIEDE